MEKLIAISDLFEISLDELVMDKRPTQMGETSSKSEVAKELKEKVLTDENKKNAKKGLKLIFNSLRLMIGRPNNMIFTALQEEGLMKKVLDTYSSKNDINIKQIVAYKDNILEIEEYRDGFQKEDTMNVMSVTKSVTSLLIGIAIDQGLINSVDDCVMDYYKEIYTPKRGEQTIFKVTIKHLLTMTAPYKGKSEPWTKVCTSEDWTLATLDVLGGRKGITNEFRYHTLGVQILLGIIRITSGMNVLDFANEYLFKPLGIEPRSNAGCESKEDQFEYLMNKNDHGKVWFLDPTGMPTAGWGLSLSAYEMAQIGLLVLNNGVYNNTRIISENWIEMMTKSYISTDEKFGNQDYGFLWWFPHRTSEVIAAIGDGGNIIYIDRNNQIVVAITAHFKPMVFDRVEYIEKNIVEALTER